MAAGKRVVVDTNTVVSGILLPRSVPGRLLGVLAAFAGKVDCLITGDADLRALGAFEGIAILTAAQYLASIDR